MQPKHSRFHTRSTSLCQRFATTVPCTFVVAFAQRSLAAALLSASSEAVIAAADGDWDEVSGTTARARTPAAGAVVAAAGRIRLRLL